MSIESKYIADVEKLVPRPEVTLEVLRMAHDQDCNISDLASKIEQDPNLTSNMLRMANSSYFGHMREIGSIKDIIVRLGYEMVKILAITGASSGLLSSPQKAYNLDPQALWKHSHACAILATIIARHANLEESYPVYTAGLLHDIGKVVLNKPLQIETANKKVERSFPTIVDLERFMLKTDHAKVGMALLQKWGLPDTITIPVGYHHTTEGKEAEDLSVKIVYLANFLVESIGIRSTSPENYLFKVEEFLDQNQKLPEVPHFKSNMESIIEEFSNQFHADNGL